MQAGVDHNNISIQYSAKPIFEVVEEDFGTSKDSIDQSQDIIQRQVADNHPAQKAEKLKAEIELDIDEKLEVQRAQELAEQAEKKER